MYLRMVVVDNDSILWNVIPGVVHVDCLPNRSI